MDLAPDYRGLPMGQITEAFPWDSAPTHLIRDRDAAYGLAVTRRLAAMGIGITRLRRAHLGRMGTPSG